VSCRRVDGCADLTTFEGFDGLVDGHGSCVVITRDAGDVQDVVVGAKGAERGLLSAEGCEVEQAAGVFVGALWLVLDDVDDDLPRAFDCLDVVGVQVLED